MFSRIKIFLDIVLIASVSLTLSAEGQKDDNRIVESFTFYHDNPEWQANWMKMGEASASEIGLTLQPVEYETTIYTNRIKVDLPTKRAASLFKWWFGYQAKELVDAGLLEDLGPLWDKIGENYPKGTREAMTVDGFTYGVPLHLNYWVWFYSRSALERVNRNAPETWDEFVEILALCKEQGISGIGNTIGKSRWTSFIVFQELLLHSDTQLYKDLMGGRARYTDPGVVAVMELWKELLDQGYFAPMDITYTEDIPVMLAEGSLAFAPFGDWYGGNLASQGLVSGEDYGAFILPAITPAGEGAVAIEASPLVIGKNSENIDEATAWLEWYSQSDLAAETLWDVFKFATTKNISAAVVQADDPVLASIGDAAANYSEKIVRFWEATPTGIVEVAVDEFNTMLASPNDYMAILDRIDSAAAEVWPEYGVDY